MLTKTDFICIPYTPDLTTGGIAVDNYHRMDVNVHAHSQSPLKRTRYS
ncbi:MAG: hypothetical protein HQ525_09855 [Anaerolineae bacterium]|nr:hypothetical protein [Anaerolineae bacterium]